MNSIIYSHADFSSSLFTDTHTFAFRPNLLFNKVEIMFDFQKLVVYQKAKDFRKAAKILIRANRFGHIVNDQLERAALSIPLNIAEGTSRFSKKDRKNFYTVARGSGFECASILDILLDEGEITAENAQQLLDDLEEISKMLFSMIKKLE